MYKDPNYPILIGLGYKARRGKDTVANAIIEARGAQYDIRRYVFADALREEVEETARGLWATYSQHTPIEKADPRMVALLICDAYDVPFDPDAKVEPNYPYTKQRALYQ